MNDSFKCDGCGCEAEELSQSGDKLLCSQCHGQEEMAFGFHDGRCRRLTKTEMQTLILKRYGIHTKKAKEKYARTMGKVIKRRQ